MPRVPIVSLVVALALALTAAFAQTVPICSTKIQDAISGAGIGACTRDLGRSASSDPLYYLFMSPGAKYGDFCAQSTCRTFLTGLATIVQTNCTIYGTDVKKVVSTAQEVCAAPPDPTSNGLPTCGSDIVEIARGPYGSTCTSRSNATDGTILYAKLCADADCRVFFVSLVNAYVSDCMVGGVSLKSYLAGILKACPDFGDTPTTRPVTTTPRPIATTAPVPTTADPLETTDAPTGVPMPGPTTKRPVSGSSSVTIAPAIVMLLLLVIVGL